jgi:hypothetical protein
MLKNARSGQEKPPAGGVGRCTRGFREAGLDPERDGPDSVGDELRDAGGAEVVGAVAQGAH